MAIKLTGRTLGGMKIRNKVAGVGACLVLTGVGAFVALPAEASQGPTLTVCNSSASVGRILVWSTYYGYNGYNSRLLWPGGQCAEFPNSNNEVRVDVNPEYAGDPDVDSYYIGVIGSGYGPCHDSENDGSDPPNASTGVRYNTNAGHC